MKTIVSNKPSVDLANNGLGKDLRNPGFSKFRKGTFYKGLRILSLLAMDSLFIGFSWVVSNRLGTGLNSPWQVEDNPYSVFFVAAILVSIVAARGLYGNGEMRRNYRGLVKAVLLGNVLLLLAAFFYEPEQFVSRSHFLYFLLLSSLTVCLSHFLVDTATANLRKRNIISYPVFLIADLEDRESAIGLINQEQRYTISGVESARSLDRREREKTFRMLKDMNVSEVFVTWSAIKKRLFLSWYFQSSGITLRVIPIGNEPLFKGASLWVIGGLPSLSFDPAIVTGIDFKIKRVLDFLCALLILIVASPLYAAISISIKLDSPGPVFYQQTRIGLRGRPFKVWKFRSMVVNADSLQQKLENLNKNKDGILFKIDKDPRITRVGGFVRKYSLDELPQVFNVLIGEMSLVGPRPLPVRDVEKFSEHHFIRHEVLPGITGLWQVSGRSDIVDFEHVLRLDLDYIENWSLWLDLSILLRTVGVVFGKSGAY